MLDFAFVYSWVTVPLLIFSARIIDVSIGTLRVIFLSKGYKKLAPILGFFEVIIWILAVTQVMKHLDNYFNIFAYGAGFATGNYIGLLIDEKLSLGLVMIRIIFKKKPDDFYTIEDVKTARQGIFPDQKSFSIKSPFSGLRIKGK
jgi:uncharacterized protein YebE (UPF0316 family)